MFDDEPQMLEAPLPGGEGLGEGVRRVGWFRSPPPNLPLKGEEIGKPFRLHHALTELYPGRGMIARLFATTMGAINASSGEPVGRLRGKQQMIDAETGIALPRARLIIPIGPDAAAGVLAA